MNFLLDTCVISEMTKIEPAQSVADWLSECDEQSLFLSVLTLGELEKGIRKLPQGKKRGSLESWLANDITQRFAGRILPVDSSVAKAWGIMMAECEQKGKIMPVVDGLIAATAMAHKCSVVTRNNTDIEQSGVPVFNPWT